MKKIIKSVLFIALLLSTKSYAKQLTEAAQDDAYAQYCVRVRDNSGSDADQNEKEAFKWYRREAEQGNIFAQFCLGFLYTNGRGVTQNKKEAYAWFSVVAENRNNDGAKYRDSTARELPLLSLSEAIDLAAKYYKLYSVK